MALPSYVGKTAYINSSGTGTPTLDFSATGRQAGDLLVAFFETPNRALGATPSGWTQFASSPQATGSTASAGGVRLAAYYRISDGTEGSVVFASNSASHCTGIGFVLRGVDQTTPIHVEAGSVLAVASAAFVWDGVTTSAADCLVVNLLANDRDASSMANLSSIVNAALANVTLRHDQTSTTDSGGGVAFITGEMATAGVVAGTTATNAASNTAAFITFAVQPSTSSNHDLAASELNAGTPSVGGPELAQDHGLTASGVAVGSPALDSPTLIQTQAMAATGIASDAPVFGTPTVVQGHALGAAGIETGSPVLGSPSLVTPLAFLADRISGSAPIFGAPAMAQAHILVAVGISTGGSSLGAPTLSFGAIILDVPTNRSVALPARNFRLVLPERAFIVRLP